MTPRLPAGQPLYRRIREAVRARVLSGQWPEGFEVPSEHRLMAEFRASRMTVHRALRELSEEGLLLRVQGVGTFVAERRPGAELLELRNIADEIAARGNHHTCHVHTLRTDTADVRMSHQFNLPAGAKLFHSVLVHLENDVPIQHEERWVNPAAAPLYLDQDFTRVTPTEYLIRVEPSPDVEHLVEAALPGRAVARLLGIPETEPCLRLTRRTRARGRVVTVAVLTHPGSRYRFGTRFHAAEALPLTAAG
jgi:GntR family histidine utilization transcriptional repressor